MLDNTALNAAWLLELDYVQYKILYNIVKHLTLMMII